MQHAAPRSWLEKDWNRKGLETDGTSKQIENIVGSLHKATCQGGRNYPLARTLWGSRYFTGSGWLKVMNSTDRLTSGTAGKPK
jgi:hypothetical protein